MIKGIEHTAVYSMDTTSLKKWYERVLGFKTVDDNGKGNYFLSVPDGSMLELVNAEEDGGVKSPRESGIRHIALEVDDFESMVDRLLSERVEVVTPAVVSPTGVKTFFFRDPDGNVLHLIWRPIPMI